MTSGSSCRRAELCSRWTASEEDPLNLVSPWAQGAEMIAGCGDLERLLPRHSGREHGGEKEACQVRDLHRKTPCEAGGLIVCPGIRCILRWNVSALDLHREGRTEPSERRHDIGVSDPQCQPAAKRWWAWRIVAPGGCFVHVGVHPCFCGRFADRTDPEAIIRPGHLDGHWTKVSWTDKGLRDKVGGIALAVARSAGLVCGCRIVARFL
jgi:hypothetical protein